MCLRIDYYGRLAAEKLLGTGIDTSEFSNITTIGSFQAKPQPQISLHNATDTIGGALRHRKY